MLELSGKVINIFTREGGKNKDGEDFDETHKVQLMGERSLPNGDKQMDLMDLTVKDLSVWNDFDGKDISIEIGAFSPQKGSIIYFVAKGATPKLANTFD